MPTFTAKRNLPAPTLAEPPNGPAQIGALAQALDDERGHVAVRDVLDPGMPGHTFAGRSLVPADWSDLGLTTPAGHYGLGGVQDTSGNGRDLVNKGAVPFGVGVEGVAATAAVFAGSTAQALWRADTGAADPFRIRTGSVSAYFRTQRGGTLQRIAGKSGPDGNVGYFLQVRANNVAAFAVSPTGASAAAVAVEGTTNVCDGRYHRVTGTYDGSFLRLYVDGRIEGVLGVVAPAGPIFPSTAALNVGGTGADAATATVEPFYGHIDEFTVSPDVLSEERDRLLYAVKIAHGAARAPRRAWMSVRRRRKGAPLAAGNVPSAASIYNGAFGASLTDTIGRAALVENPATGLLIGEQPGPDGLGGANGSAFAFAGNHAGLSATDAGLPSGTNPRTYGGWFKIPTAASWALMGWGTTSTADARLTTTAGGLLMFTSGSDQPASTSFVADGRWFWAAVTEDFNAADGVRRKLWLNGRCITGSTVMNPIVLAGAGRFRIGANPDGTGAMSGNAARLFVSSAALTPQQLMTIYAKAGQDMGLSPKAEEEHVERIDGTNVYFIGNTLNPEERVELGVAA